MSTLAFNIAQFFPLLNYQLLPKILSKAGFDSQISNFSSSYLINRQTQYIWNHFVSLFFKGIGQVSVLSPILSTLYIASIFHIFLKISWILFQFWFFCLLIINLLFFRKRVMKNLIQLFFVVIALSHLYLTSSVWLLSTTNQKSFTSWDWSNINSPSLYLRPLEGSILQLKDT